MSFLANIFGYLLNFLYELFSNYGLAIIVFSIIIKLILLPLSAKQQKTMKKSTKMQEKMKEVQEKYKNDPERMNQEVMALYKKENMSPFSGCFSAIVQVVLLFAIFYLVRSPLTYMKKVDPEIIENYSTQITEENEGTKATYMEIEIIRRYGHQDEEVNINMEFLGLDLSSVPSQDLSDWRVYVIPGLYVLSSFISMRITTSMQNKKKKDEIVVNEKGKEEKSELDAMASANKSMSYMMPIMSISIAIIAPLGLALYWLVNNILMIIERLLLNKFIKDNEEEET